MSAPPWWFGYAPVHPAAADRGPATRLVIASRAPIDGRTIAKAPSLRGATITRVVDRPPIVWTIAERDAPIAPEDTARELVDAGAPVRYVAADDRASLALGPPLDLTSVRAGPPRPRPSRSRVSRPAPASPGTWFLRAEEGGVAIDRALFGAGEGTRLAVIDDDAALADELDLDAEVLIGLDEAPRRQPHGPLMIAWATRSKTFDGVAPGASARLYVIPKPGASVSALPRAIVRAVDDGADVIVCATYVEGTTSPMLDDALAFAARAGRRGRGTAVVFAVGREASSREGSTHASFSLGLGEPASDPRAFAVGPSARGGGWFFWRDRRGKSRPFANRGPAVRWLAPGDDITYPFAGEGAAGNERLTHAESSGAAAIAAGVMLLVIAHNPTLSLADLDEAVTRAIEPCDPKVLARAEPLADPFDALPEGRDRDGHNGKHGYGVLHAARACLVAADPFAAALVAIGEDGAARAFFEARRRDPRARGAYSIRAARWLARALLRDTGAHHAARTLARHARLTGAGGGPIAAHGDGAVLRHVIVSLRRVVHGGSPPARVAGELNALDQRLCDALSRDDTRTVEGRIDEVMASIFARAP